MKSCYICAPYTPEPITYHNGKVKRVRRAKRNEVPEAYRKNRWKQFKSTIHEIWWCLTHI